MNRTLFYFRAISALVILTGAGQVAHAEWIICNKTAEELNVAIAYKNPSGYFTSRGWWRVGACHDCKTVLQSGETSDTEFVYLHAHSPDGRRVWGQGGATFCTNDSSSFKYFQTSNCAAKKPFLLKQVDLKKQWTSNLTGPTSTGAVCLN